MKVHDRDVSQVTYYFVASRLVACSDGSEVLFPINVITSTVAAIKTVYNTQKVQFSVYGT